MLLVDRLQERFDEAREKRSAAGHARPADPAHARLRRHARVGHRPTAAADFPGRLAGQPGLALSGALPPRAAGVDRLLVGRLREQPASKILRVDAIGPEAT